MSKHSDFCPGCGQPVTLHTLHNILKEKKVDKKAVLGLDIGCSLLAWDMLPINTFQTHHGRVVSTMVGFSHAQKDAISIAYAGDGGAYAIGLQSLLWAAKRNESIFVIVTNNAVYGMTGGQTAPTSLTGQKTSTSPSGYDGLPINGPEMIRGLNTQAYLARTSVTDIAHMKSCIEKAIDAQQAGNFALVECISFCPLNWKVTGNALFDYVEHMKKSFPIAEF